MSIAASILPSFFNRSATVNILSKADAATAKGDTKSLERELKNVTNKIINFESKNKCTTASGKSKLSDLNTMKAKLKNLLEPRSLNRPTAPQAKVSALPTARTGEGAQKANQQQTQRSAQFAAAKQAKIDTLNTEIKPLADSFDRVFGFKHDAVVSMEKEGHCLINSYLEQPEDKLDLIDKLLNELATKEKEKCALTPDKDKQLLQSTNNEYTSGLLLAMHTLILADQITQQENEDALIAAAMQQEAPTPAKLDSVESSAVTELKRKIEKKQDELQNTRSRYGAEDIERDISKLQKKLANTQ